MLTSVVYHRFWQMARGGMAKQSTGPGVRKDGENLFLCNLTKKRGVFPRNRARKASIHPFIQEESELIFSNGKGRVLRQNAAKEFCPLR